ncbi:MAG: SUMF1/EgtB/PvdO family nonheme iron enzyme [Candidatus Hydrogenedentes bacterium]|nr:SUMF1/EgtB/PvdO family nonheme iron enzyme [Candidatus Hydrogenedentota bacterium]
MQTRKLRNVTMVALAAVCVTFCAFGQEEIADQLYEKGPTFQATVLQTHAKYDAWKKSQPKDGAPVLGPWYITAPLKASAFSDSFFPEQGIDLGAKSPEGQPLWTQCDMDLWADGKIHDLRSDGSSSATYLYRTITSPKALSVVAGIGSDDGVELWLNGAKVHSNEVARATNPEEDKVSLALNAGENALLMKVYNIGGGYSYYFTLSNDPAYSIWKRIAADFPSEFAWIQRDLPRHSYVKLFNGSDIPGEYKRTITTVARGTDKLKDPLLAELETLDKGGASIDDSRWLDLYLKACKIRDAAAILKPIDLAAMRRSVEFLAQEYPSKYTKSASYLERIKAYDEGMAELLTTMVSDPDRARQTVEEIVAFQREVLLDNPLLDFDQMLIVKRAENSLGLPQNWQGNCAISSRGYDNEIATLSPLRPDGELKTLYKPEAGAFVGDIDLHFDANKMLFSMPGSNGRWQIWEMGADGTNLRQVTPGVEPDVDNYDACYLPDERIMFASTRCFQGVPCVGGSNTVANLCRMDQDGQNIRQLCFDQDHNWCPTVLNNGRLMYSRWEYSDTPHYFSRLLFHMNPDGTNQVAYYGSNSYWPNSIFYARPIPGSPSAVVAIVSGHHGVPRMGELVVIDPGKSRFESSGVVQRIPGYGEKVEPKIMDTLVDEVWPKFLHPYPLSDKYFLVSCKINPESPWSIYLVDIFNNMIPLKTLPGFSLFEPVPFRATPRPPVIPDRVKPEQSDATVYVADVYKGQGLKGVPRGTVKSMRLFEIYYTYPQMGGHINIGVEGPWDVHRILGTVPVYDDGSAYFTVPANIPIALQPLDAEGRALQVMRSWFVGMPGEAVSCIGCHEQQNMTPPASPTLASRRAPDAIAPWNGPARGFSFKRDVQPMLDKYCVGCHNGTERSDGKAIPDLSRKEKNGWSNFTPSYLALHPYVRRPGPESDYHMPTPTEFHASTSELIQMLEKGHHGVKLDADAWQRLYTWIDLNVPDHGTWSEQATIPGNFHQRRLEMRTQFAGRPEDPEVIPEMPQDLGPAVMPAASTPAQPDGLACNGWPFDTATAKALQASTGGQGRRMIALGNGVNMELALIPAGEFVMGSENGSADEMPRTVVKIDTPFWMGVTEVTNAQFHQFNPAHDNGVVDQHNKDHTTPGYPTQDPNFPVIRVTWEEARTFCNWIAGRVGEPCTLPTEAQWEWACRAGAETPFWYGTMDADFSTCANLADAAIRLLAVAGINPQPIQNPSPYEDFLPKDSRFNDGCRIVTGVAAYQPNAWGLYDMHGNVAEWTSSTYKPYPYAAADGREDADLSAKKVVRGGSWIDRPFRASSSFRLAYEAWRPVHNVGFRVIIPVSNTTKTAKREP